uniref:Cation-transporting ATPase n=1 Tax=Crocodylus porosus TaxID=8502 RepID=A0A7M4F4N5_CROPO
MQPHAMENGHWALLNQGEDNEMEMFGYKTEGCRRALCIAGYILSCGALWLVFYWKPAWDVWANCIPCSLQEADVVLLRTTVSAHLPAHCWLACKGMIISPVQDPSIGCSLVLQVRCIQVQKIRYVWNISGKQFQKIGCLEDHHTCSDMHDKFGSGLSHEEQAVRELICGPNAIDVRVVPIWKLLVKEVLHPFYVFQLFSICLWIADDYMEYASAILLMSLLSVSLTVYDLRKQSVKLYRLVESHTNVTVTVFRKTEGCQKVKSHQLVPGDTLVLTEGKSFLPCDAVLISGRCIVNESMLTGESIPVTKAPLPYASDAKPWRMHCSEEYKRHILFCGTEVIQTKADGSGLVKAIVLHTGFNTAKGDLVRSILYPKPINFKLYRDAMSFLMCLIALAIAGMIYSVCIFALNGEETGEIVKKALDVVTIAVPPALPAALTTGIIYTQRRLKKKGIFCISPQRINMCGQLNLICFDKTGTLTEDGLDLWGVVPAEGNRFQEVHSFASGRTLPWGPVCGAMVSCHSLVLLDGRMQGDPLDLKMFEATGWVRLRSPYAHKQKGHASVPVRGMAILHHFPFTSALQRMSVIAQEIGGARHVFMKGAPEMVAEFCRPETVPLQFASELQLYAAQGFRVIGLAHRVLQAGNQPAHLIREDMESGLVFLGLLIMENRLKRETKPVLEELSAARIRSVMVTGDNIQTAVTVAKNASMISPTSQVILVEANELPGTPAASVTWKLMEGTERGSMETDSCIENGVRSKAACGGYHFAISGKSYQVIVQHCSDLLPRLLLNGTVFARMSPGQKSSLVEEFQKLGYYVGMCGDGANDCGALKVAHAGISLSEQEASVASPFTTRTPTIECVPQLIREGRAALVTSLCMFKYMALYSIIQYLGVLLLYWQLNSFGVYQFLFQDLAINTVIGVTMSLNGAYPKLVPHRPPSQLVSPPLLLSLVLNILFSLGLQICGFLVVQEQSWYSKEDISSACLPGNTSLANHSFSSTKLSRMGNASLGQEADNGFKSYENSTVWLLSTINCIAVALVVSKGKPFRQPVYTNYQFVLALTVQLGVCLFLMFADMEGVYFIFDVTVPESPGFDGRCFPAQEAVTENRALWMWLKTCFRYQSQSRYQILRRLLSRDPAWPPLNTTTFSEATAIPTETDEVAYVNLAFNSDEKTLRRGRQGDAQGRTVTRHDRACPRGLVAPATSRHNPALATEHPHPDSLCATWYSRGRTRL